MATDYNKLKVTDLKEILKERGIPQTGLSRKQQIVEALQTHDAEQGDEDGATAQTDAGNEDDAKPNGDVVEDVMDVADDAEPALAHAATAQDGEALGEEASQAHQHVAQDDGSADFALARTGAEQSAPSAESAPQAQPASDAEVQPIVLEENQPVSKEPSAVNTPQRASPAAESTSSETRKRKRRSPTPPLSQESVNKRLRAAEDVPLVTLPEDRVVEDAPVAVERTAETAVDAGKIIPFATSDDVMQVDDAQTTAQRTAGGEPDSSAVSAEDRMEDVVTEDTVTISPAIHPATRALYIRDLVRPLQSSQLRSHLVSLATPTHVAFDDSVIQTFHLDTIRTHAFVIFTTTSAAARTRSALHARIWPDEPTRKSLWVDFVPDEKVEQWIETEKQAEEGKGRAGVRRWEVIYANGEEGVEASLGEITSMPSGPVRQQSNASATAQGVGMPNAPLGPRGDTRRPSISTRAPPSPDQLRKPTPAPATSGPAPSSASFDILDERFHHTTTKPKLYYLPVASGLVAKREEALAALTSRDWNPEREGSFTGNGDVRRYTFEDGDRVVDGGPDIGNFGRPRGMEIGGPRAGRGGYRGGRR